jgi:hypothetical protein
MTIKSFIFIMILKLWKGNKNCHMCFVVSKYAYSWDFFFPLKVFCVFHTISIQMLETWYEIVFISSFCLLNNLILLFYFDVHVIWFFFFILLSVKKVKNNMQLAFIEKLFLNREIGTSVHTRYLCFKGMCYESESYLCHVNCVQLWKALARFWCGNTQLEAMLGAWKSLSYTERLC